MKINVTKSEKIEAEISDWDAKQFVEKFLYDKLLKIDYTSKHDYYLENNRIIREYDLRGGSHALTQKETVRDATEEDIAIFKTLEVLKKQK